MVYSRTLTLYSKGYNYAYDSLYSCYDYRLGSRFYRITGLYYNVYAEDQQPLFFTDEIHYIYSRVLTGTQDQDIIV